MRYPIWMFLFAFVIPPFSAHALLVGKARIDPPEKRTQVSVQVASGHTQAVKISMVSIKTY